MNLIPVSAGERFIPIVDDLLKLLKEHWVETPFKNKDHLVFPSEGTINDGIGGHLKVHSDIMYSVQSNITFSKMDQLDMKSINYYNHGHDCLDLAKSRYVKPTVDNPQLPTYGID